MDNINTIQINTKGDKSMNRQARVTMMLQRSIKKGFESGRYSKVTFNNSVSHNVTMRRREPRYIIRGSK